MSEIDQRLVHSVLHPTDFSKASDLAFAQALAISLLGDTTLTILHAGPEKEKDVDWSSFPPVRKTLERWGLLKPDSPKTALLDKFDMRVKKIAVRSRTPILATVKYLVNDPVDLVVLATEGRKGLQRIADGSDAETIGKWSRSKTLFVSPRARRGVVSLADGSGSLKNILVPVDTAPDCSEAVCFAARAAQMLGDEPVSIVLFHAGNTLPMVPHQEDEPGLTWRQELRQGDPVRQILAAAQRHRTDLIVMATAGHESVLDALRGSITEQILRDADCPVLAVPTRVRGRTELQ